MAFLDFLSGSGFTNILLILIFWGLWIIDTTLNKIGKAIESNT
jgi:hypothetical protein